MRADEIFVLLLLLASIAAIVAINRHSKRQVPAEADALEKPEFDPELEPHESAPRTQRPNTARRH